MLNNFFYITTTLPYINSSPHIGFALEIIEADVIARYQKLLGKKVIFNTGTDEHGQKIYQKALKSGIDPQAYCDKYSSKFSDLKKILNLNYSHFIRTTDEHHIKAAQHFWGLCAKNGDIYKANYEIKYCVGCELEKTDGELKDGYCPLHPNQKIEIRKEENYFFRFSKYQKKLLELYKNNPDYVKPEGKYKEIVNFVGQGLKDFSISRLKEKMSWGVPVPGDSNHVMYVWFDALVNYIATLGWPDDKINFQKFWPGIQLAGKDNLRQQSAMWQAMLMSAGLPNSKQILINGFISINGQKMSKSLGNVISPGEMTAKYGADAARYILINLGAFGPDMDVSWNKFDTTYTADLSNGLGNLCSRVAKMCEKSNFKYRSKATIKKLGTEFSDKISDYELTEALRWLKSLVETEDKYLAKQQPWKKTGQEQASILQHSVEQILTIAYHLQIFMPKTANKLLSHFSQEKIVALKPIFPRLN